MPSSQNILGRLDYELDQCHNPAAIILGAEEALQFDAAIALLSLRALRNPHQYQDIPVIRLSTVKNKLICVEGDKLYLLRVDMDTLQNLTEGLVDVKVLSAARKLLRN